MLKKGGMLLSILMLLSACATVPAGPNVMVLPGVGKPFDQFQVDDMLCRQYAQGQLGPTPAQEGSQKTVSGAVIGTLLGAAAGAAIGAAAGGPDVGAAIGAGTGLLMGTAVGSDVGNAAAGSLQWRYDVAYTQCMYAKGNQVPGAPGSPSHYAPPPPNAPPPPGAVPPPPRQAPPSG
jgi:YmgG-like glycine-zipper protein